MPACSALHFPPTSPPTVGTLRSAYGRVAAAFIIIAPRLDMHMTAYYYYYCYIVSTLLLHPLPFVFLFLFLFLFLVDLPLTSSLAAGSLFSILSCKAADKKTSLMLIGYIQ